MDRNDHLLSVDYELSATEKVESMTLKPQDDHHTQAMEASTTVIYEDPPTYDNIEEITDIDLEKSIYNLNNEHGTRSEHMVEDMTDSTPATETAETITTPTETADIITEEEWVTERLSTAAEESTDEYHKKISGTPTVTIEVIEAERITEAYHEELSDTPIVTVEVSEAEKNNYEYHQEISGIPTVTMQVPEEYLTTEILAVSTREPTYLLEASPTAGASLDSRHVPLSDINFDLKITTTREGLNVEASDAAFDPSQIAKATSYEGSSNPTATRSATVTTTWDDPEEKQSNLTKSSDDDVLASVVFREDKLLKGTKDTPIYDTGTTDYSDSTTTDFTTVQSSNNDVEYLDSLDYFVLHNRNNDNNNTDGVRKRLPVLNVTSAGLNNDTDNQFKNNGTHNQTDEVPVLIYEVPQPELSNNGYSQISPAVIIALCICLSIVLVIALLSVVMCLCRRHRNRSKVYLSHEAAKPRAFFTRPMNPIVLPNDSSAESIYMVDFQKPRAPIMLGNDQTGIYFIEKFRTDSPTTDELDTGMDNGGFVDIPLSDRGSLSTVESRKHNDPPKYKVIRKPEGDSDSGIRVWSSTGSLHTLSPEVAHCSLPPPPYSPDISKESVCLSVHSLPPFSKNGDMLGVSIQL